MYKIFVYKDFTSTNLNAMNSLSDMALRIDFFQLINIIFLKYDGKILPIKNVVERQVIVIR